MTVLRLLPIAPFTVVNLVAGASEIPDAPLPAGQPVRHGARDRPDHLFGDRLGAWLRQPDLSISAWSWRQRQWRSC